LNGSKTRSGNQAIPQFQMAVVERLIHGVALQAEAVGDFGDLEAAEVAQLELASRSPP
jgi:hypothetical protein